jgi:hypothetical protein
MVNIKDKMCIYDNCNKLANYSYKNKKTKLYCKKHKLDNMINSWQKICINKTCSNTAIYNLPDEKKPFYCYEHKTENMINVKNNKCQENTCQSKAKYGYINKKIQYCFEHKKDNMINLKLDLKCSNENCDNDYVDIINNKKYCLEHIQNTDAEITLKKLCKYCDMRENSKHICSDCKQTKNKKEWSIIRYLRKHIDTKFEYNSSKMLQDCSNKRPDVYFELVKHCVIVEIDENQHNSYRDSCECSRINEIVNGIGGKSVIIIRYNPDVVKNKNNILKINLSDKLDLLIKTIKKELCTNYDDFQVKLIQLFYNDNYEQYQDYKEENITKTVCI